MSPSVYPENPYLTLSTDPHSFKSGADADVPHKTCAYLFTQITPKRYAEVPGSGYRKLDRVKSSQQDETPGSTGDVISDNSGAESSKKSPEAEGEGHSSETGEATSGGVKVAAAGEEDSEELDGAGRLPVEDFRNQR